MRIIYLLSISCLMAAVSLAQNVGIGTNTPHPSAGLEVNSNSKGVLFPRVTTAERNAITNPATGLMVFDVEKNLPYYFNGIIWVPLGPISPKDVPPVEITSGSTTGNTTPYSVAISGSYAAAGMTRFDTLGFTDAGAVQIYKKTNGVWAKSQIIIAPDPSANDFFGFSLNMEGAI